MESKKVKIIEVESRMVVTRGWRLERMQRYWSKGQTEGITFQDLLHSIMTIVNKFNVYFKIAKRVM